MKFYSKLIDEAAPGVKQAVPACTNVGSAEYPQVYADGRVHFRVSLPGARRVLLEGGPGLLEKATPMSASADGMWTLDLEPSVPGFHYYWLNVDGTLVNDPGSETFLAFGREVSGIEIPDAQYVSSDLTNVATNTFYDPNPGKSGELSEQWYRSESHGEWLRCLVYTPPDYEQLEKSGAKLPVLYLLPAEGEDETAWSRQGRLRFVMDNMIAGIPMGPFPMGMPHPGTPRCKQMIVVMPCFGRDETNADATPPRGSHTEARGVDYSQSLKELITVIDSRYRTQQHAQGRAIAGAGVGGELALSLGLLTPEALSQVGVFSGSIMAVGPRADRQAVNGGITRDGLRTMFNGALLNVGGVRSDTQVLWFGLGTAELQLGRELGPIIRSLNAEGSHATIFYSSGTGHEWQTWRRCLYEFAPALFTNHAT